MGVVEIYVSKNHDELSDAIAGRLITHLVAAQANGGFPHIALTGGRIGTSCLSSVAASPLKDTLDWRRLHVWWGDERYVPRDSPDRNDVGADEALLSKVPVDPANVHHMPSTDDGFASVEDAAETYTNEFNALRPVLDVMMLGIGPDGHVASIFPELPAVHETRTCVAVHGSPKPPPTRLTLTFPVIQSAKEVWILASGEEKAKALKLALAEGVGEFQIPAAGARGYSRTLILADAAAASLLGVEPAR